MHNLVSLPSLGLLPVVSVSLIRLLLCVLHIIPHLFGGCKGAGAVFLPILKIFMFFPPLHPFAIYAIILSNICIGSSAYDSDLLFDNWKKI